MMYKLETVYFESEDQADDLSYETASYSSDESCFLSPPDPDPQVSITVPGGDQQKNTTLPPSFQEIFKPAFENGHFEASKLEALELLADKNIQAQRVVLNFGPDDYLDGNLNEVYGPISHLWSSGCLEISIWTYKPRIWTSDDDYDDDSDEEGESRKCNGQMIGLLKNMPHDFFTCAELKLSMKYMTFWMSEFIFLRAYCQKLVFEEGTRNPIGAKFLEYLHNDLPVGVTPKWDSHTVCMQISGAYEDFVNRLIKQFRQAHLPLNYKLIFVMNYKRKYNVANFLINNPITKEHLELKQTIHHISDDDCQELFEDQNKHLAPEVPFDNIPIGYALLAQIERRSDS